MNVFGSARVPRGKREHAISTEKDPNQSSTDLFLADNRCDAHLGQKSGTVVGKKWFAIGLASVLV